MAIEWFERVLEKPGRLDNDLFGAECSHPLLVVGASGANVFVPFGCEAMNKTRASAAQLNDEAWG
jgi:hypothetical protein